MPSEYSVPEEHPKERGWGGAMQTIKIFNGGKGERLRVIEEFAGRSAWIL